MAFWGCLVTISHGKPHTHKRTNPNLVPNPEIKTSASWDLTNVIYDPTESRTPGSGSFLMDPTTSSLTTPYFPVEPGKRYTASIFMKTDGAPFVGISMYGALIPTEAPSVNIAGSRYANSKVGEWEECVFFFTVKEGQNRFKLKFTFYDPIDQTRQGGKIWLDDAYVGLEESFEEPPTPKEPFNGGMTRVDELGNITVKRGDSWEPFFPLCMYASNDRDLSFYSNQGFNCIMSGSTAGSLARAKAAGIMTGISVSQYINKNGFAYNNLAQFESNLTAIVNSPDYSQMLFFYWDNEHSWGAEEWALNERMVEIARRVDRRNHPIYILQGSFGSARSYDNDIYDFQDLTGTYATVAGKTGHVVLDNLHNQKTPVTIAQFNNRGKDLRADFWAHVARGARGMGYYRDKGELNPPVEQTAWWDDFPKIREEVDALLPVLRQKHWVDWSIRANPEDTQYGVREFLGEAYFIIANPTDTAINPSLSMGNFPYIGKDVRDAITNEVVASFAGNSFDLRVEPWDARIVKVTRSESSAVSPVPIINPTTGEYKNVLSLGNTESIFIPCEREIKIMTRLGETVTSLACANELVQWDGRNEFHEQVALGIYLVVEPNKPTRKVVVIE